MRDCLARTLHNNGDFLGAKGVGLSRQFGTLGVH